MSNQSTTKSEQAETSTILSLLEAIPKPQTKALILSLAFGAVNAIRSHRITFAEAEDLLFNTDTLFYCDDTLKDRELAEIISAGIQLEDALEILGEPAMMKACDDLIEDLRPRLPSSRVEALEARE